MIALKTQTLCICPLVSIVLLCKVCLGISQCVCAFLRERVRACVRACMHEQLCECMYAYVGDVHWGLICLGLEHFELVLVQ